MIDPPMGRSAGTSPAPPAPASVLLLRRCLGLCLLLLFAPLGVLLALPPHPALLLLRAPTISGAPPPPAPPPARVPPILGCAFAPPPLLHRAIRATQRGRSIRVIHGRKLDVDNSNKNNNMKRGMSMRLAASR